MKRFFLPVVVALLASFPSLIAAEEAPPDEPNMQLGLGARVGGYGFRQSGPEPTNWQNCRMNGTGIFGTLDFGNVLFGELSADFYHSVQNDWDMDRISFFPAAAVGARMFAGRLISPYIQAGGGPEFTRIELAGKTANKTLPAVFMGFGGELNIKRFHLGTNLRVFSMGLPEYEVPSERTPESYYYPNNLEEPEDQAMRVRGEVAAQVQFTARYTF